MKIAPIGAAEEKIHFVRNTMIDTLLQILAITRKPSFWDDYKLEEKNYFLVTLHRPSNVDDPKKLDSILSAIEEDSTDYPIVFPVHPVTKHIMDKFKNSKNKLITIEPQVTSSLFKLAIGGILAAGFTITCIESFKTAPLYPSSLIQKVNPFYQ